MKKDSQIQCEWSPEIPEFKKLGRKHLSSLSSENFWEMLINKAAPLDDRSEPLKWEREDFAEEYEYLCGELLPDEFNLQDLAALKSWTAFAWEHGSVVVGVLQHLPTGLCRPFLHAHGGDDFGPYVGPRIKSSSRQDWALGCFALFRAFCLECLPPLTSDFINEIPQFISRNQIKDLFSECAVDKSDVEEFFKTLYTESHPHLETKNEHEK